MGFFSKLFRGPQPDMEKKQRKPAEDPRIV